MIDSHSHIYADAFDSDRDDVIARARQAGVEHIILPNENLQSLERIEAVCEVYPGFVSPTIGLHPEDVDKTFHAQLDAMEQMLNRPTWVAVGEVGIDLYWDKTYRDEQVEALDRQLRWCVEYDLPFIIHCREGIDECLWVLNNFGAPLPRGVFHSFTGTCDDIRRLRRLGDFYFGINGIVTFKKSEIPSLLPEIGLERILIETDSPYLAPVPKRGKRNESAFVVHVAQCIAQTLQLPLEQLTETIDRNTLELFTRVKLTS